MHTHTEKTCFVFSYCCGKGRCNTKYSKLLDLSSSDYTPVQGSFGPHYTHQCATYKNATICSLILLNGMQMIKRTVVLEKKKKQPLCPLFALLLQRQQHIVIQNVAILARSVLSWTEASSLQLQFTFQDMIVPCSRLEVFGYMLSIELLSSCGTYIYNDTLPGCYKDKAFAQADDHAFHWYLESPWTQLQYSALISCHA